MNFAITQQIKADLMGRLRKQRLTVSNHGSRKIYSRNILLALAAITSGYGSEGMQSRATTTVDQRYLSAHCPKALLDYPGILNAGRAQMIRARLSDQKNIVILNAGGLSSVLAPEQEGDRSKRHADATDLSRFLVASRPEKDRPKQSSSIVLPDIETCVVFPVSGPSSKPTQGKTIGEQENEKGDFELLRAMNRCYLDVAISSINNYGEKNVGANIDPQAKRVTDLMRSTFGDAKLIAEQNPGSDPYKMSRLANVQVKEAIADVFALLAAHKNGTHIEMSDHANKLMERRVIQSQINSGHDTAAILLAISKNARSLHETMQMINLFTTDTGPGRRRSDASELYPKGFSQLFSFVIDFTLDEIGPARNRMLQLQAIEVMSDEQPPKLNVGKWLAEGRNLKLSREGGMEIEKIRAGIMRQADGADLKRGDSDDLSLG